MKWKGCKRPTWEPVIHMEVDIPEMLSEHLENQTRKPTPESQDAPKETALVACNLCKIGGINMIECVECGVSTHEQCGVTKDLQTTCHN